MVLQILKQLLRLRLPGVGTSRSYQPLGGESNNAEKSRTRTSRRKLFGFRWLRKLRVLLPSFLHASTNHDKPKTKLRPTAWLDGLRGIAALFVVLHHMSLIWFPWAIHDGWTGWSESRLIQLPIIRLVISGPANVMVFFVVSGYALSWRPLRLAEGGHRLEMYRGLASSIARRHTRLFLPAVVLCAPAPLIAYFGGYDHDRGEGDGRMPGAAIAPMNPPRFDTLAAQFAHYAASLVALSDVYSPTGTAWVYSDSLWTLPIEFRSSLVVFTLLIALSGCTVTARVIITLCVAFYSWWYFHWGELLFIGGMLTVESGLYSRRIEGAGGGFGGASRSDVEPVRELSPSSSTSSLYFWWCWKVLRSRTSTRLCRIALFLTALFILSMPEQSRGAAHSYGFKMLVWLIPARFHAVGAADYFWTPLGAITLLLVINRSRLLQRIFTTRLAQYLGHVSFALYLVHMFILHSLGFWLGTYFLGFTGSESDWQYGAGIGLAAAVVGCVIIWAADLGSRTVDANTVRFTAWAYGKLCKPTRG